MEKLYQNIEINSSRKRTLQRQDERTYTIGSAVSLSWVQENY